jgi:protein-S-isoprenylcysteine O-methyltransferase Ste14
MKATAFEFRFRFWIILAIYLVGFTTPWDFVWHVDGAGINAHVWGWLAVMLSRRGAMSITAAFDLVLVVAIVCAAAGAWLRMWGAAYLSHSVVHDEQMRADSVVAAGPYRYVRNPLYVGSWLNTLALTLLLRPSGAVFMVVGIVVFLLRLILAEEVHLRETLGEAYVEYCARVPRIFPALRPRVTAEEGARAEWGQAAAAEVYMWMSAAAFAVFGWQYDATLLLRCVLVSLGASLVVRGLGLGRRDREDTSQG